MNFPPEPTTVTSIERLWIPGGLGLCILTVLLLVSCAHIEGYKSIFSLPIACMLDDLMSSLIFLKFNFLTNKLRLINNVMLY